MSPHPAVIGTQNESIFTTRAQATGGGMHRVCTTETPSSWPAAVAARRSRISKRGTGSPDGLGRTDAAFYDSLEEHETKVGSVVSMTVTLGSAI